MDVARQPMRPVGEVLGGGVLTGVIAGFAAGVIDAIWSWGPASQFVPGVVTRLRFVVYSGIAHALAGAIAGLAVTAGLLALSRATRLGDLLRHGWRAHVELRVRDPRTAVGGLGLAIAGLPITALALVVAYRLAVPYVTGRKEIGLVVIVAMAAALGALAVAVALTFLAGRAVEVALAPAAARVRALSSPFAPIVATGAMIALALIGWLIYAWETARLLPLHGPAVLALGLVLAIAAARPGLALAVRVRERLATKPRIAAWAALPAVLLVAMLVSGGSAGVVKAEAAYTGLGGDITRTVRGAFDWDRDGYARFLGGGDCDDGDRTVHPGALEIPDDGIDQNCIGGDAPAKPGREDIAWVTPVPASIPPDFRVLLITIDTVRADHFGMYGYHRKTTPNLDALAKDATVFEHGWAHAPSTRYSIPAILTGRLPLDVRYDTSVEGWPGLSPNAHTIAEALHDRGFATGAITNYWYFDKSRHMDQGFDEYDNANAARHQGVAGKGPEQTRGSSSKEQTDKALAFVDRHADQRWFLWVHYYDPHYAYEPHAETPFGGGEQDLYDGEIAYTDLHVGRLLDHLRQTGAYAKTVVVVTGDHGEGFGEHGVTLHGFDLYAAQTKVPLIVRVPGLAPRRSTTPAGHIDILPTLVDLAGGTPDREMMGRSLVDAIAGADRDRVVFQEVSSERGEKRAAASRQCHVLYNVVPDTSWEVYRVDDDPGELEDLAAAGECADTRGALERWFDASQVPAGAAEALLSARPAIANPVDADLGDSVRLLGCEAPATAKPGESIDVQYTFEVKDTVEPGWKLFVHVEWPTKPNFILADHDPARPLAWWKPGQFIRYKASVTIPRNAARGTYTVGVGLFRGPARAKVVAAHAQVTNNEVACTTFEVAP